MGNVENRKLYRGIENTTADYESMNFIDVVDGRIASAPEVPMYTYTDYAANKRVEIMPADYKNQYQAVGTWLNESGYLRTNIAIMGDNSYQWLLAFYSIVCSNNIAVPMDKNFGSDTIRELLERCKCKAMFYSDNYEERAMVFRDEMGIAVYKLDEIETLVQEGAKLIESGRSVCTEQEFDSDAPAIIMFTSGTTGKNKGVVFSQKNFISCTMMDNEMVNWHYDTVVLLPFHHSFCLNVSNFPIFILGKTMHINQNLRYMYQDFQNENPEGLVVVPMFLQSIYDTIWRNIRKKGMEEKVLKMIEENHKNENITNSQKREMFKDALDVVGNRLKFIVAGGAPMDKKYYEGFQDFGIVLMEGYGITECSPLVASNTVNVSKRGSVGKMLPGIEVKIDQPDKNKEGEVCVRGPIVMLGYYNDEEETKKVIKDGWFHTGDLGYIDEEDFLYITGRKKNLIILSNGENVSPEELEAKVLAHPAVREIVVYGKSDKIAAQIYINEEYAAEAALPEAQESIKNHISQINRTMPVFKQIAIVEFREVPFEKNSSQKILRNSVK